MFDNTDPELEAKAPGLLSVVALLAGTVIGWGAAVAAYFFIARVAAPAATALWRAYQ